MFIAMNRFRIAIGREPDFEELWRRRDSHLQDVPGFREFHLLRGPTDEEATLFASHTVWNSRADFESMNRFLEGHQIHPIVDRVFEFEDAVEAFDFFMNGDFMGKVVIRH